MRTVIVHYHLFKNAGTSLDLALRAHFGEGWTTFEGDAADWVSPDRLAVFIESNPDARVVSSHTAILPTPTILGVNIVPAVFLREPIARAWSSYDYERAQVEDTPGTVAARGSTFAEYVTRRLDGDGAIADFQTRRLARAGEGNTELERALDALRRLPFIGIVEDFEASLARLERLLVPYFPGITLRMTRANAGPAMRPDLQAELGNYLYQRLVDANRGDLALWRQAVRMHSSI